MVKDASLFNSLILRHAFNPYLLLLCHSGHFLSFIFLLSRLDGHLCPFALISLGSYLDLELLDIIFWLCININLDLRLLCETDRRILVHYSPNRVV